MKEEDEENEGGDDMTPVTKTITFPAYLWEAVLEEAEEDPHKRTPEEMVVALVDEAIFEPIDDEIPPVAPGS